MRMQKLAAFTILLALAGCGDAATISAGDASTARNDSGPAVDAGPPRPATRCTSPVGPGRAGNAPVLAAGTFVNVSPPIFSDSARDQSFSGTGITVDPCDPSIIYLSTGSFDFVSWSGLFKTTDGGASWREIGATIDGLADHLESPTHVRVDPADNLHLYVLDCTRGDTEGFWVSHDGGETVVHPAGFTAIGDEAGIFQWDTYDIAVDPTDFNHVLLSNHSAWGWDPPWSMSSGVLESRDGGETWIAHPPPPQGWGSGHSINFLFVPDRGIGDANTWLLGTQGAGMWRTTDGGANWTQVTESCINHGGGTITYTQDGVLYASGFPHNLRSMDNGASWTALDSNGNTVFNDGSLLWTGTGESGFHFQVSDTTDGLSWRPFSEQAMGAGPFDMAIDRTNHILYSSNWGAGVWALQLPQ